MKNTKNFALELAQEAGGLMRENFVIGMQKEWKHDNTPLTATDTAINQLVVEKIKEAFPSHSILGEEESFIQKESEYTWVCDPIDGTIPFSHGLPLSTFALALTREGQPLLAVAYDPYMDRLFVAEKGKGAYLNNKKINVSKATTLHKGCVDYGAVHQPRFDMNRFLEHSKAKAINFFNIKSCVYASMLVASGEFLGSIYAGDKPWDGVASKLIVEEAGGKATDLFGNEQRYDQTIKGIITSNGFVHNELVHLIKNALNP